MRVHKLSSLDRLVVQLALQSLIVSHLPDGFHKVFLDDVFALGSDRKQSRLRAHVSQIGTVEVVGKLHHRFVVDISMLGDRSGVDFENFQSAKGDYR